MNSSDSETPDPESPAQQADAEDRMLEVLLAEIFQSHPPPDQRGIILQRLNQPLAGPAVKKTSRAKMASSSASRSALVVLACLVLLAAGVAVGIRYRNAAVLASIPTATISGGTLDAPQPDESPKVADRPAKQAADVGQHADRKRKASRSLPSRRIELTEKSPAPSLPGTDATGIAAESGLLKLMDQPQSPPSVQKLTLVSSSVMMHLNRYWHRIGLQPTEMLAPARVAAKLRARFGIDVPDAAVDDVQSMRRALNQAKNTQPLAIQVLAAISSRPAESMNRESDQRMIAEISETLGSGSGFDRLYASWFNDQPNQPNAPSTSISELLGPLGEHETLVNVAAVALDADMRCQRCHDLRRGGMGRHAAVSQHDYWQFAATIAPSLGIRPNTKAGWFYDTADGRRRLAEPLSNPKWADGLTGSRSLANGLVAAIWAKFHGRPLVASPYDLTGGAEGSELERLRTELADDLVAHDFDLLRTITLILSDSIVGRSTPAAVTPNGVLVASDEEWQRAVAAIESFAASPPDSLPSTRGQRLRLVQSSALPTLRSEQSVAAVLAQPLGSERTEPAGVEGTSPRNAVSAPRTSTKASPAELVGLPMRPIVLMPAWITELPDFDSRLQHIAHLAGLAQIPQPAKELATQMRDAGVEEALILQRIWWILRPMG